MLTTYIQPVLWQLHWFQVQYQIHFKILGFCETSILTGPPLLVWPPRSLHLEHQNLLVVPSPKDAQLNWVFSPGLWLVELLITSVPCVAQHSSAGHARWNCSNRPMAVDSNCFHHDWSTICPYRGRVIINFAIDVPDGDFCFKLTLKIVHLILIILFLTLL